MSSSPAIHFRCDSCGDYRDYSGSGIPYGWVEANLKEVDGKEAYALHVCPQCARHAVDEWLPSNTWWGSTEKCKMTLLPTGEVAAYEHLEYIMHCELCQHEFSHVLYNEDGDTWVDEKPNYCPNCGAKVVE